MSQINLFDLAKEIRSALPGWSTKVNITDIFIWEKDPATWQTTAIIKLAPRPAGEIYAVVNSGIPAGNIYGLTQTWRTVAANSKNNWELKNGDVIWLIPRRPIAEFQANNLQILKDAVDRVKTLQSALKLADALVVKCLGDRHNLNLAKYALEQHFGED